MILRMLPASPVPSTVSPVPTQSPASPVPPTARWIVTTAASAIAVCTATAPIARSVPLSAPRAPILRTARDATLIEY